MILFVLGEALHALWLLNSKRGELLSRPLLLAVVAASALLGMRLIREKYPFNVVLLQSILMALAHRNRLEALAWFGVAVYVLVKDLNKKSAPATNGIVPDGDELSVPAANEA
jgi:hypothetical protein